MLYPLGDRVVVRPQTVKEISEGGIHVPDTVQNQQQIAATTGTLVAIGPSAKIHRGKVADGIEKVELKVGDKVMFSKWAGATYREDEVVDGQTDRVEYRLLRDEDVAGYMDDDEPEMPDTRKSMVK